MVSWWGFCDACCGSLKYCDACREAATRHLVVVESIVERDNSGFVLEHRGHDCHCDCCYQRICAVFCTASTGFRLDRVKETRSSSLFPFFLSMVVSCVYFVITIARMSIEDQCQGGVLMKMTIYPTKRYLQFMILRPSTLFPLSHIHHSNSPSTVPCAPNIHRIRLGINIDSRRLFASILAVRLHIVSGLQDQLAVARDDCPNQTAGKGSLSGAVADGAAGVRICIAEVLEIVVGIWCGDVVRADVLFLFDGVQYFSFSYKSAFAVRSRTFISFPGTACASLVGVLEWRKQGGYTYNTCCCCSTRTGKCRTGCRSYR